MSRKKWTSDDVGLNLCYLFLLVWVLVIIGGTL